MIVVYDPTSPLFGATVADVARSVDYALRRVPTFQREVYTSKAYDAYYDAANTKTKNQLDVLKNAIEDGKSLDTFYSKHVHAEDDQANRILKPNETDWLLNDWRIHHLHFRKKGDDLLYVIFPGDKRQAYFVAVAGHEMMDASLAQLTLLKIILEEWPQRELLRLLPHIPVESFDNPTPEMIVESRKNGCTLFYKINNQAIMNWMSPNGSSFIANELAAMILSQAQAEAYRIGFERYGPSVFATPNVDYGAALRELPAFHPIQYQQIVDWDSRS